MGERRRIPGGSRGAGGRAWSDRADRGAHRRGLEGTLASYRETVKVALVHLDTTGQSERVVDAIRATVADTQEDMTDMAADEAMTRRALDLLGSKRNDAYEAAPAALREDTQAWWADTLACDPDELGEGEGPVRSPGHQAVRSLTPVRLPALLSACLRKPAGIGPSARAWEIAKDPNAAGRQRKHA